MASRWTCEYLLLRCSRCRHRAFSSKKKKKNPERIYSSHRRESGDEELLGLLTKIRSRASTHISSSTRRQSGSIVAWRRLRL